MVGSQRATVAHMVSQAYIHRLHLPYLVRLPAMSVVLNNLQGVHRALESPWAAQQCTVEPACVAVQAATELGAR